MMQSVHHNSSKLQAFGSHEYPIDIMDDEEEKLFYNKLLEQSRNVQIIKKAYLCKTSLQVTFAVVKTKFVGQLQAKQQALKNQIARYFYDNIGVNIFTDFFLPKIQPDYSNEETKPIGIALMVYGVDFMDTRQIGNMFSIPNEGGKSLIHKITWINDSNCIVTFYSPQNTQLVLQRLSKNPQNYKMKIEQEGVTDLPKRWFQIQPYNIYDIERNLYVRYITSLELDLQKTSQLSRYLIFENAQKGLELYLLTKFNAFEEYDQIKQQIEFEKYRKSSFNQNRYFMNMPKILVDTPAFQNYVAENRQISAQHKQNRPSQSNGRHLTSNIISKPIQIPVNPMEISIIYGGAESINDPPVIPRQNNLQISIIGGNSQNVDGHMVDESVQQINRSFLAELKQSKQHMMNEDNGDVMIEESEQVVINKEKLPNKVNKVDNQLINDDVINRMSENERKSQGQMKKSDVNTKNKLTSQLISLNIAQTVENTTFSNQKGLSANNFNSTITAGTTILSTDKSMPIKKPIKKANNTNQTHLQNHSPKDIIQKINQPIQLIDIVQKNKTNQIITSRQFPTQAVTHTLLNETKIVQRKQIPEKLVQKLGEKESNFEYNPYLINISKTNEQRKPIQKTQVVQEKKLTVGHSYERIQQQRQFSNPVRGRGRIMDSSKSKFHGNNNRPNQNESTGRVPASGQANQGRNFFQDNQKSNTYDDNNDSTSY